jgi:hypothetical protein
MGNHRSEGVITAEWDFAELRELWETAEAPVRRELPVEQVGPVLAQLYQRLQRLPHLLTAEQLPEQKPALADPATEPLDESGGPSLRDEDPTTENLDVVPSSPDVMALDELPILSSVTSRWPLPKRPPPPLFDEELDSSLDIHSLSEEETEGIDAVSDDPPRGP